MYISYRLFCLFILCITGFIVSCFPLRPQRRSVSEMEKAVFPLRKCTVFIFRKNRLRPPLWGSWGRAAPESCGRSLETGGAFLASFFRRRKKEGYKADAVRPKRRNLQTARGYQIKILNPSGSQNRLLHSPETSSFQTRHKKSRQKGKRKFTLSAAKFPRYPPHSVWDSPGQCTPAEWCGRPDRAWDCTRWNRN